MAQCNNVDMLPVTHKVQFAGELSMADGFC